MPRRSCYTGEYKLNKPEYLSAKYYALRYNAWLDEYNSLKDSVAAVVPDDMPRGTNIGNPTEKLAVRREELRRKMEVVEQAAIETDSDYYQWILKRVVNGLSYDYMYACDGLCCSRATFYRNVRKFYWILAKKI